MAPGVFEQEWVQKKASVARCANVGLVMHTVIVDLLPQFFTKQVLLVGNGGAGTIKDTTLNPAITGGEEVIIKEHVLVHDAETGDIVWEVVDDPKYSKLKNILKITPSAADPADTKLAWKLEYEPRDPATPPPHETITIFQEVMKALMNHLDQNPNWP